MIEACIQQRINTPEDAMRHLRSRAASNHLGGLGFALRSLWCGLQVLSSWDLYYIACVRSLFCDVKA